MRRFINQSTSHLLLFFLLFLASAVGTAKEYSIPLIKVEAQVRANGDIHIVEYRNYTFKGAYSWADYRLPLRGFEEIKEIQISAEGKYFTQNSSEQPGTFTIRKSDDAVQVKWFFKAENQARQFKISYTLTGAVVVGKAWSSFYWTYLGDGKRKTVGNFELIAQLPQMLTQRKWYVWNRSGQKKLQLQRDANGFLVKTSAVEDDEVIRLNLVFPTTLLASSVAVTDSDFDLEAALAGQKAYLSQLAKQKQYAFYGKWMGTGVGLVSVFVFLLLYRLYGKRHRVTLSNFGLDELGYPLRLRPAEASWLFLRGNLSMTHLMMTLFDLARRGYFLIKEDSETSDKTKKRFFVERLKAPAKDDLTEWEALLLREATKHIAEGEQDLNRVFGDDKATTTFFYLWKKELTKTCKAYHWIDHRSRRGAWINGISQFLLLGLAIWACVWAGPVVVASAFLVFALMIGSFFIVRHTPRGEQRYQTVKRYRKCLKQKTLSVSQNTVIDVHFIRAMGLGLSQREMNRLLHRADYPMLFFTWLVLNGGHQSDLAAMTSSFDALARVGSSSITGGIGASAGVAGGGAVGGAG